MIYKFKSKQTELKAYLTKFKLDNPNQTHTPVEEAVNFIQVTLENISNKDISYKEYQTEVIDKIQQHLDYVKTLLGKKRFPPPRLELYAKALQHCLKLL
jgi:hypothetical protein